MKSVVLEITGRHAVVVNDDGDFIKIRNRNFKVGQRIITHDLRFKRLKFASAAAAAAMVLFVAGGAYAYYTPYTEVSLDVNPSMVLQINYFNKVIGVAAMNADAEQIAEKLDIINDDVNTAMDEVVNELSEQGYIDTDTDAAIVVTSTSQDQTRAQEMLQTAERKIEQKTERLRIRAEVLGDCVGQQLVTRAREYGVSPGKLMLVEKYAISTGDPATVDVTAWLDKPVKEIMAATKANKKAAKGKDNTGDAETSPSPPAAAGADTTWKPGKTPKNNKNANGIANGKNNGNSYNGKQDGLKYSKPTATPCVTPCPTGDANKFQHSKGND